MKSRTAHLSLVVVDAGDERRAGDEPRIGKRRVRAPVVRVEKAVVRAGPRAVPFGIRDLEVVQDDVGMRQHLRERVPWDVAGGFDRGPHPAVARFGERGRAERRLAPAFVAGERQAPAGLAIERRVLLDLLHRREAPRRALPDVVLDAHAHVQTERDRHRRRDVAHDALELQNAALRRLADVVHRVERVGADRAAADRHEAMVERSLVQPPADQALGRLELRDAGEHEIRLDAQLVEHRQPLAALAVGLAHVDVQ
jgi:hypothetical protein